MSDEDVYAAAQALAEELAGGPGLDHNGNTRGVRRNPTTGEVERF